MNLVNIVFQKTAGQTFRIRFVLSLTSQTIFSTVGVYINSSLAHSSTTMTHIFVITNSRCPHSNCPLNLQMTRAIKPSALWYYWLLNNNYYNDYCNIHIHQMQINQYNFLLCHIFLIYPSIHPSIRTYIHVVLNTIWFSLKAIVWHYNKFSKLNDNKTFMPNTVHAFYNDT